MFEAAAHDTIKRRRIGNEEPDYISITPSRVNIPAANHPPVKPAMKPRHPYHSAHFVMGAHNLSQLPPDDGAEVAFAGRSNAGKSSAINTITNNKSLARTSKRPGRTQQINYFELDESHHLVDLPGYGYAKVPVAVKRHWQQTLSRYLQTRSNLRGLILLMDVRHPLTEYDRQMLDWAHHAAMPVHILLTKADKLKRGPASASLQQVRKALKEIHPGATAQLFSSLKHTGVDTAWNVLDQWLGYAKTETETGAEQE